MHQQEIRDMSYLLWQLIFERTPVTIF